MVRFSIYFDAIYFLTLQEVGQRRFVPTCVVAMIDVVFIHFPVTHPSFRATISFAGDPLDALSCSPRKPVSVNNNLAS